MLYSKNNMRILLLGGSGFLGSLLKEKLLAKGYEVIAPSRQEFDICMGEVENVNLVINATGYTDVDGAESNQEMAYQINAEAVKNLAISAGKCGARFLHFSTDYVFDGEKIEGYTEEDEVHPLSVYGASKRKGEEYILEYGGIVIRTSFPFGNHPKCFLQKVLGKIEAGEKMMIVDDLYCMPTSFDELAERVGQMTEELPTDGIYHLVGEGEMVSRYGFVKAVLEMVGSDVELESCARGTFKVPAERPQYSALKNTRLLKMKNWKEALENYLK